MQSLVLLASCVCSKIKTIKGIFVFPENQNVSLTPITALTNFFPQFKRKGASDLQPHPQTLFFNNKVISYQKLSRIVTYKALCLHVCSGMHKICLYGKTILEIRKCSLPYKTSKLNIIFPNCLQMRQKFEGTAV